MMGPANGGEGEVALEVSNIDCRMQGNLHMSRLRPRRRLRKVVDDSTWTTSKINKR